MPDTHRAETYCLHSKDVGCVVCTPSIKLPKAARVEIRDGLQLNSDSWCQNLIHQSQTASANQTGIGECAPCSKRQLAPEEDSKNRSSFRHNYDSNAGNRMLMKRPGSLCAVISESVMYSVLSKPKDCKATLQHTKHANIRTINHAGQTKESKYTR